MAGKKNSDLFIFSNNYEMDKMDVLQPHTSFTHAVEKFKLYPVVF